MSSKEPDAEPEPTPSQRLAGLAERAWETVLEITPTSATLFGDSRFDDRLADISPPGQQRSRQALARLGEQAAAVPVDALSPGDRLTRSALGAFGETIAAHLAGQLTDWTVDPLDGPQVALFSIPDVQQVDDPGQARAMVARWRAMGPHLDQYTANLQAALAEGRVAAAAVVRSVLGQMDAMLARPVEDWPLLSPLADEHPDWTVAERERFAVDLDEAVRDGVLPAYARLREVLAERVLPRARPDDAVGIDQLPGGAESYRRLVRAHVTRDVEPEELHRLGLAELGRVEAELVELGHRLVGTDEPAATWQRLRSDQALRFASREEVLAAARDSVQRAWAALDGWFGLRPAELCEVVPVPRHEERQAPPAHYWPPAQDGSRPGRFFVNTAEPSSRFRYESQALAFHEAIPGHHLQIAVAMNLANLPTFRRLGVVTAYAEGWGLYAERLADEMGLYTSDLDRFGILSFDAWRAARLVVDTGLHALGWDRPRAIAFLTAHSALDQSVVEVEVDRYIAWPGQALAYKTGQLELLRLRAEARQRMGAAFDIREFHDLVLGEGSLPLRTLAELVEAALPGPDLAAPARPARPVRRG